MADIDDDWKEIRGIPRAAASGEDAGLLDSWRDVRNYPEFFYYVVKGVGINYMAIFKIRCMGEFRRDRRHGGPSYRGIAEKAIWQGPSYRSRPEEQGKQYTYSKASCDLTLEEAICRFNEYLRGYLRTSRYNIRRWEESIAELQRSIDVSKRQDAEAEALDIALHLGHNGLEMRLMAEMTKPLMLDSVASVKIADAKPRNKKEAKLLTALKKRGVDISALSRADIDKLMRSRQRQPEKALPKPGPNEPCPCGRTNDLGGRLKFKKCCGSLAGDLHFFVADVKADEPMSNDDGRVFVFSDQATAAAAAKAKGWLGDRDRDVQVISLNPDRWEHFKSHVPHVTVTLKEFEVGDKIEEPEDPRMGTMVYHEPCPDCDGGHGEYHTGHPEGLHLPK
jgi:hypothetical protein